MTTSVEVDSMTQLILVNPSAETIEILNAEQALVVDPAESPIQVISAGAQGPRGVPGQDAYSQVLYRSYSTIATPSSTLDQAILSQIIAANVLATDGDRLRVTLIGDFLNHSGTPNFTPKIKWGAYTITTPAVAETASLNSRRVTIQFDIIRRSATSQAIGGLWMHTSKGTTDMMPMSTTQTWVFSTGAPTETLANPILLEVTSNFSVANANNRMRSFAWTIELLKV